MGGEGKIFPFREKSNHYTGLMQILCVGAHPDDVEIGMGGTVANLVRSGHSVFILDLTNGEPTPHGSPEIRAQESTKSAQILGAHRQTLTMSNRFLEDTIDNRKRIATVIRKHNPEYIFAPYFDDAHPDHIAASKLVDAARFYAKLTKSDIEGEPCFPKRVIYYFPVHLRLRIQPTFLNDISNTFEQKKKAILCYHSQFEANNKSALVDSFLDENRYWGFQAGCEAAEPFFQKEAFATHWPNGYL